MVTPVMTRALLLVGALLAATAATSAHHSFAAEYFEDQSTSIEGDVQEFQFRNPHAMVIVRVQEQGRAVDYRAEWAGAGRLARQDITADTLKPGDRVVIGGSPGRDASAHRIHLKSIERPADGWSWTQRGRRNGGAGRT